MITEFARLMAECGYTNFNAQTELALRSGVSRELICKLANGKVAGVVRSRATLAALAWALDVPIERLGFLYLEGELPRGPRSAAA